MSQRATCALLSFVYCYDKDPLHLNNRQPSLLNMPGRPSKPPSATHPLSKKSSVQTLKTSASAPLSNIPNEGPLSSLRTQVCTIFENAQNSSAGHRKLVVGLRKIQEHCIYGPPQNDKDAEPAQVAEDEFNLEFTRCAIRVMGVKKGENVGDKSIRFICLFLKHASEKGWCSWALKTWHP